MVATTYRRTISLQFLTSSTLEHASVAEEDDVSGKNFVRRCKPGKAAGQTSSEEARLVGCGDGPLPDRSAF